MHWQDTGIVLSSVKYGENSAVVRLLTHGHGLYAGVMRGAGSKNNRGIVQTGNIVSADWNARLAEHLGSYRLELKQAATAHIMDDALKLAAVSSICAILELALPERHPYPKLFFILHDFINHLLETNDFLEEYIGLELEVLAESGYGLDLSQCAATGKTDDLIYVSPKSGRAVCREAGEPYKEKLLHLPAFLVNGQESWVIGHGNSTHDSGLMTNDRLQETLAGMQLTGYFLEHSLLAPHGKKLPAARTRLYSML